MISSEIGSVASMRQPRMTMPASVSSLMRAAMYGSDCFADAHGAIGLRRDQGVRQAQVVLAQVLVIPQRIGAEARLGLGKKGCAGRVAGDGPIDVVRARGPSCRACSPATPSWQQLTLRRSSMVRGIRNERADLVAAASANQTG